jgi:hypothetical protein
MNSRSNQPMPDSEQINQRIATAVRSHRIKLRVVVLNRRVTLNQINASLAQISSQLRDLQRPQ